MTAKTIYEMAASLSGREILEEYITDNDIAKRNALFTVNQVLWDFSLSGVSNISENITLTPLLADAVVYGVARLIAANALDIPKQNELTEIFNLKRAKALGSIGVVKNSIPV